MLDRFVKQTKYTSQEDFIQNFKVEVPENFNFGYDVVDAWAAENPEKKAILWTNDQGVPGASFHNMCAPTVRILQES